MSAWVALTSRAKLAAGENVLILGATGVAAQLAVQIAKHLGMLQKGLKHTSSRIRFVQVGESAGKISLAADTLHSSGLELLGNGFGSASMNELFQALAEFFRAAARLSLKINIKPVPLPSVPGRKAPSNDCSAPSICN